MKNHAGGSVAACHLCVVCVQVFLICTFLVAAVPVAAQDGASVIRDVVFLNLGKEFKDYQFQGYPVSNYGILSAYSTAKKEKKMKLRAQICTTFDCLGVPEPTDANGLVRIEERYVAVGSGAPLRFKGEEHRKRFLDVAIPVVSQIIGVSANWSNESKAQIELVSAKIILRSIKPAEYYSYIVSLNNRTDASPTQQQLVEQWKAGRLLIVTNDIVVQEMVLNLKLEESAGRTFEAEAGAKLVKDAKGKFDYKKQSSTEYTLTITEPLILAKYGRNLCHWKLEPDPCTGRR